MIEKLPALRHDKVRNKINEIIDFLNEDECAQGCRTELPSLEQVENINVDDIYIAEKNVDKLEESFAFDIVSCIYNIYKPHFISCPFIQYDGTIGLLEGDKILIENELNKILDDTIDKFRGQLDQLKQEKKDFNVLEKLYQESLNKYQIENYDLKQQKPDDDIVDFLKNGHEYNYYNFLKKILPKLKKHFGINND